MEEMIAALEKEHLAGLRLVAITGHNEKLAQKLRQRFAPHFAGTVSFGKQPLEFGQKFRTVTQGQGLHLPPDTVGGNDLAGRQIVLHSCFDLPFQWMKRGGTPPGIQKSTLPKRQSAFGF